MLRLLNIRKKYVTGELVQTALDGVSLNLRDNEFVAILGPSGSGKTTLLNVIGGLDQYDSGDLIIDNVSTKNYKDRDWDSYRNHTVGFVFQSYNLIPHQTVLSNVELALTISGVSHSERRKRAIQALEEVGLGNQIHKKPNQMSGGQMQRVAIARALVNNPSILLADEPTGALDSETSVQVMELLKKVAKGRLVVMVTHNPELAMDYANRIVRVKDGKIIDDTNPCAVDEKSAGKAVHKNMGRASMSFFSALALSFNNLKTKKARTLLTSFAGSIGIIGIALIMSLSAGFQSYIDKIQENTLANYPLMIQSESADMTGFFTSMMSGGQSDSEIQNGTVSEKPMISQMFASIGANDLAAFKKHMELHMDEIGNTLNCVQYGYGIKPCIYADNTANILQVNPASLFQKITGNEFMSAYMDMDAFQEMIDNKDLLNSQYQILQGRWPEQYNELVFVLPTESQLPDHIAYTLGLKDMDSLDKMLDLMIAGQNVESETPPLKWTYDDLMNLTFRLVSVPDLYRYREEFNIWEDMSSDHEYMKGLIENGEQLHIVGIVCPQDTSGMTSLSAGIAYHPSLTQHVIEVAEKSEIVQSQKENVQLDVFSGKGFHEKGIGGGLNFKDMISIDGDAISSAFGVDISEDDIVNLIESYLDESVSSLDIDTTAAEQAFLGTLSDFTKNMLTQFISSHDDGSGSARIYLSDAGSMAADYLKTDYAANQLAYLSGNYSITQDQLSRVYQTLMTGMVTEYIAREISDADFDSSAAPGTAPPASSETTATVPAAEFHPDDLSALLSQDKVNGLVDSYLTRPLVTGTSSIIAAKMMQQVIIDKLEANFSGLGEILAGFISESFYVDEDKITDAFHFTMGEEELFRLMSALSSQSKERNADTNLRKLGYADLSSPTSMSLYMADFESKEKFMNFLDEYNFSMLNSDRQEQVIHYSDMTGMMMASVRLIINSISYVLIAFVAVSLIVSSIMIGIITYISVMERTKEIGVLRAMGASRHNVSQVFNAETFIIGLCSGLIGIGLTLLLLIPGNYAIHSLIGNADITAQLPVAGAAALIILSMLLTLISGLIPARQAAKKDPVIALRTE